MNYYYLGASLPELKMLEKPAISTEEFRLLASMHLKACDCSALADADSLFDRDPIHPFMKEWKTREMSLRNALVRVRAAAAKKDPQDHLRRPDEYSADSERVAAEAMSASSPLEKEQVLDRHRWKILDEMAAFNPFATEAILAYSLQLGIASRWGAMNHDAGLETAEKIISSVPSADGLTDDENEPISENKDNR